MDYKILTEKQERLNRMMNLHFASFFDDMPLTPTQALALEFIVEKAEKSEVYQKDLEAFLSVRGSSATSLINNLERDGYISRKSVKFDGRYKHLAPTPKAFAIRDEVSKRIEQYIESLFIGISDEELRIYESVLEKMERNVR